jgi:glyoxylase-like metal-dependent hydrolase (beta-lactamase superfamily II)
MLEKVTDQIYYYKNVDETDRPALGIVIGNESSLIIDSGNSPKHAMEFKKAINTLDIPEVKYLVLTHHHWDHTFGINEWNVATIASKKTYELMKTYCDIEYNDESLLNAKNNHIFNASSVNAIKQEIENRDSFRPINCTMTFTGELNIDLGGITCCIREIDSPHTDDATIVYVPEEKVIFLGDSAYGYTSKGYNYFHRERTEQMINSIEQYEADYYLCSHESICTRSEILTYWNQLRMGSKISNMSRNLDDAIIKFREVYNTKPTEEDLFFIKSYGEGEAWGRTGLLNRDVF